MLVAMVPLWRRHAMSELVLSRLRDQGVQVIAAVSDQASRAVAYRCGAAISESPNLPLGSKFNAALHVAREFGPRGVVVMGSDNCVTDSLFDAWQREIEMCDMVGITDGVMYDVARDYLGYWPGYAPPRRGIPLGSGRCYSARLLDRLGWNLWPKKRSHAMDGGAQVQMRKAAPTIRGVRMFDAGVWHIGLKTGINMTRFPRAAVKIDPSYVDDWFGAGFRDRVRACARWDEDTDGI